LKRISLQSSLDLTAEKMKITILVVIAISTLSYCWAKTEILSDKFIESINQKGSTWVARRNFPEDTPIEQLRRLNGAREDPNYKSQVKLKVHKVDVSAIPDTFDGRTHWSQCESLKNIRNQGNCGSCWAFAATEVMTDRLCIATNGKVEFMFSPEDLMTCCTACGDGCDGGWPSKSFDYWMSSGIVSGGDYQSQQGCQPYAKSAFDDYITPKCATTCLNTGYKTSYQQDKHFGTQHYRIAQNVQQIQTEIINNGPVSASYTVYEDFYNYDSGVYQHLSGDESGSHAIKILGWGTENGTPYWLVANSWGADWSSLDGFFKILRGSNECGIEYNIQAGTPKV
jgi:cathepsin B